MLYASLIYFMCIFYSTVCSGVYFFFQAEDGIRDGRVTGVQTCALPIYRIQPGFLPAYARSGEGTVRYLETYHYQGADWVFAAFACADGDRNCAYYLPGGMLKVVPAAATGSYLMSLPGQPDAWGPASAPEDGHVYECCGKVGRISRHETWCPIHRAD